MRNACGVRRRALCRFKDNAAGRLSGPPAIGSFPLRLRQIDPILAKFQWPLSEPAPGGIVKQPTPLGKPDPQPLASARERGWRPGRKLRPGRADYGPENYGAWAIWF